MTDVLPDAGLRLILDELEERRETLANETVRDICAHIGSYSALDAGEAVADIEVHVRRLHEALGACMAAGRGITSEELAFIRPHAATRARAGVSLAEWLQAFRIGHGQILNVLLDAVATRPEAQAAALGLMQPLVEFIDVASTHAAEAYLEAQQELVADSERARRDLLEELLAGRTPGSASTQAAAAAAGLTANVPVVAVVAAVRTSQDETPAHRAQADRLAAAAGGPLRALAVVRHDEIVVLRAVRGDRQAEVDDLSDRLRQLVADQDRGLGLAVAVSTVQDSLDGVPAAYHEAVGLLGRMGPGGGVLTLSEFTAFDYLTSSGDQTARRLVPRAVLRFVEEDLAEGGVLIETLVQYADADMNAKVAAHRLGIHPNTAHYRLARIAGKTECDLRHLPDVLNLLIAVRLEQSARPV